MPLYLGLEGEVDMADWRALFGAGGPHHPGSGERLVACMRPGMELVVSPGKSVAELGVIGRAEDMHAILDAETAATLGYLDQVTREQGGRRGRAQVRTQTGGLTWAVSRHATTRAGDPQPHDHVLIANVVAMGDARGGWKALDTALLRDHLHAATAIGRMAAAAKAVELGYGIEPDPGPSGRLGSFAISGVPKEAWEVHATRSAQIDAAVGRDASYQARSMAARTTRDKKEHTMVEDLLPRWRAELAEAGYPPAELAAAVERAGRAYVPPSPDIVDQLAEELLGPGGRLAAGEDFRPPGRGGGGGATAPWPARLNVGQRSPEGPVRRAGRGPAAGGRCPGAGVGGRLRAGRRAPSSRAGRPAGRADVTGRPRPGSQQSGPPNRTGPRRPSQ